MGTTMNDYRIISVAETMTLDVFEHKNKLVKHTDASNAEPEK